VTGKRNTHSYSKTVHILIWEIMYGHPTQHFLLLGNWLSTMAHLLDLTSCDDYVERGQKGKVHHNKSVTEDELNYRTW
jgi:hypothetical protein